MPSRRCDDPISFFRPDIPCMFAATAIELRSCTCTSGPGSGGGVTERARRKGANLGGRYHGPCHGLADAIRRSRSIPVSRRNPAVPDAGTAGGIHAGQELARAWRPRCGAQARHQPSPPRRQDRDGLSRLRPADLRGHLGRQCRPDAGGEAVRAREGLPPRHLRDVVDQGVDPGIHPALVVAREDGHHREPEEAVLQPAQGEEQDLRAARKATCGPIRSS